MNKDKAKVVLALRAVDRLSDNDDLWTMKELFSPINDSDVLEPNLAKYGSQKTWQRDFIYRLIEHGLVEKVKQGTHHVAYQGANGTLLREIVDECVDKDTGRIDEDNPGRTIKWFVFPRSYDPPERFAPEDEMPEDEMPEDEMPEDEITLASLQLLNEISSHLVEIRQSHKNLDDRLESLEGLKGILQALPDAVGESIQTVHDHSFNELEKGVHAKIDAMGVALSAFVGECKRLTASVELTRQVAQLKSQIDVWNNVVQSLHAQSKNLTAGLETILDVVGEMEDAAKSDR